MIKLEKEFQNTYLCILNQRRFLTNETEENIYTRTENDCLKRAARFINFMRVYIIFFNKIPFLLEPLQYFRKTQKVQYL